MKNLQITVKIIIHVTGLTVYKNHIWVISQYNAINSMDGILINLVI